MNQTTRLVAFDPFDHEDRVERVRTVNPPIYRGSTVLFDCYEDLVAAGQGRYKGIAYGTDRLPTQRALEEAVRELEGAALTRAFPSGISAIMHTLLAFIGSGDHILVCDNVYGPTARFCNAVLSRYGIDVTFIPPDCGRDVGQYCQENTRLIFLESPGSNTFELQDIPTIVSFARERGIVTVLDNTWATPLYLDALGLGIDVSVQSVTKYMSGHSDLLLGTVSVNERYSGVIKKFYRIMELYTPESDCYLALRGLKTLSLRLKRHERSALKIAEWLESCPLVEEVMHPALTSHRQHALWKRDFSGSSGLFGFVFKQEYREDQMAAFIDGLRLFGIGYSWGGFKSLITAGKYRREQSSRYAGKTVVRLNVGLEEPEDLMEDLEQGFGRLTQ